MRAMILAAGNGSGLRPLTDRIPKALVNIGSVTVLEAVVERLKAAGVRAVVINVHHHALRLEQYAAGEGNFGIHVELSRENALLDTGGGLKAARSFFRNGEDFFVHNVDVVSDIDLRALMDAHRRSGALATLAVQNRDSKRSLLADEEGNLCGHIDHGSGLRRIARRGTGRLGERAFCGIHALSPAVFEAIEEEGRFSIIDAYLGLAEKGFAVRVFDAGEAFWRDIGSRESLRSLRADLARGALPRDVRAAAGLESPGL